MKRTYDVDVRFMVRAETRQEAMEKVKKIRCPKGVSFTWVQQARYTDTWTDKEVRLNKQWTTQVPLMKDDDEIDDLLTKAPKAPPIGPFMGPKLRPRKGD